MVQEESSLVEPMTQAGESLREASVPTTLLTTKTKTRIGTWNVRTLYETGNNKTGPRLEPTRKAESGPAKTDLAQRHCGEMKAAGVAWVELRWIS